MDSLAKRNYRSELRELDWDFTGESGSDGFAGYHWYPARYVPQVPGILAGYFTEPGQRLLDPFCGSGTTLVEAKRLGRSGIGIDTNPIAVLMTETKLLEFQPEIFRQFVSDIRNKVATILAETAGDLGQRSSLLECIPNCADNAQWYHPDTLHELAAIWLTINDSRSRYRGVAVTAFSSILRFVCSQDKHWGWICDNVRPKHLLYRNAVKLYSSKLEEYGAYADSLLIATRNLRVPTVFKVHCGRCDEVLRQYADESFDAVITSPPYLSVTDYARSQRLTFLWLGGSLDEARQSESGARYKRHRLEALEQFLDEMAISFREVARILRAGHHCAIVVGESPNRVGYLERFEKILVECGLDIEDRIQRRLPRQRALSPQLETERILLCRRVLKP